MELKLLLGEQKKLVRERSNRTFMELKSWTAPRNTGLVLKF